MSIVDIFQGMKCIWGICPCCDELFRLSDATLFTHEPPPKTAFDRLNESQKRLERLKQKYQREERAMRESATRRGKRQAQRYLKRLAPSFVGRGVDPQDVKVIFDPIDYCVFRGLSNDSVTAVEFVDHAPSNSKHERLQRSIEDAISKGNLEWCNLRIADDGIVSKTK